MIGSHPFVRVRSPRKLVLKIVQVDVVEDATGDSTVDLRYDVLILLAESEADDEQVVLCRSSSSFECVPEPLVVVAQSFIGRDDSLLNLTIANDEYGPPVRWIVVLRLLEGLVS